MSSIEDEIEREAHRHGLVWMLIVAVVAVGLFILLTSIMELANMTEVSQFAKHPYFILGLLLFMLGTFWYGYDKGYKVGHVKGLERGRMYEKEMAAEKKAQK